MSRTSTSTKGSLWARALDQARKRALWTDKFPADAKGKVRSASLLIAEPPSAAPSPNPAEGSTAEANSELSAGVDWSELVRKFSKHNPSRSSTGTIAFAEQLLQALVIKTSSAENYDEDKAHALDFPLRSFPASEGGAPDYLWTPSIDNSQREVQEARRKLEAVASPSSQSSDRERSSALVLLAWASYITGSFQSTLDHLHDVDISLVGLEKAATDADLETEGHDIGLVAFGALLKAQALDRLGDRQAGAAYGLARRVYEAAIEVLQGEGNVQLTYWGEEILYRNALLSRTSGDALPALDAHKGYFSCAEDIWPASFRPFRRGVIYRSYLWLQLEPALGKVNGASSLRSQGSSSSRVCDADELYALERAYETVLKQSTSFPKAGHLNRLVLDFVDTVVFGWKAGGERRDEIDGVLEILYAATAQTFQSQRIMRHLAYVLTAQGSYDAARRALNIYYALWTKAEEANVSHVNETTKETTERAAQQNGVDVHGDENDPNRKGEELDEPHIFIETIVWAVRLLCKFLVDDVEVKDGPKRALELAERATKVTDQVKDASERKRLEAAVARAKGIALVYIAEKEGDPQTRPAQQAKALDYLTHATELDPSFQNLYHLAVLQAQLREIESANATARKAVEANPDSRDAWHLLALIVSAGEGKDLDGALQVLDAVIDRDEEDEDGWVNVGNADGEPTHEEDGVLKLGEPKARRERRLEDVEAAMQLRMTRNAVIEALHGAEAALVDQQSNLFSFYAKVKDVLKTLTPGASENGPVGQDGTEEADLSEKVGSPPPPSVNGIGHGLPSTTLERYHASGRGSQLAANSRRKASVAPSFSGRSAVSTRTNKSRVTSMLPRTGSISAPATRSLSTEVGNPIEPARTSPVDRRARKLLVSIWLMSAATFRRAGRLEEARIAIQEAEDINAEDADVWLQFALLNQALGDLQLATTSFSKALSFEQDHIPSLVHLARSFLVAPKTESSPPAQPELAESLMTLLTQTNGWDVPEAWFVLAQAYSHDQPTSKARQDRARECLIYALQLEETNPIRPWFTAVPECL